VHGRPPSILFASQSTGRVWRSAEAPTTDFWLSQQTSAANPTTALADAGCTVFVEMGHGSLSARVQSADPSGVSCYPTLAESGGDCRVMSTTLATLYARGVDLDWTSGHRPFGYRTVSLPTYPFERQRYWIHDEPVLVKRARGSLA